MSYQALVAAKNPLVYWKLDENSGNFANSGSLGGTATHGTDIMRGFAPIPGAYPGQSVWFGGGTGQSFVRQNINASLLNSAWTMECWFRTTKTDATIFMYFAAPYAYFNTDAAGKLSFTPIDSQPKLVSPSAVNDGNWKHVAAVHVPGGTSRLYLNGSQVATANVTHSTFSTNAYIQASDHRTYSLNGAGDEFAFYGRELTAAEVSAHYTAGLTTPVTGSAFRGWGVPL